MIYLTISYLCLNVVYDNPVFNHTYLLPCQLPRPDPAAPLPGPGLPAPRTGGAFAANLLYDPPLGGVGLGAVLGAELPMLTVFSLGLSLAAGFEYSTI